MTKGSERRSINQERKGMPEMALKGGRVHQQGAETPLVKALGDAMHGVRLCTFKPFVYDDHRARARMGLRDGSSRSTCRPDELVIGLMVSFVPCNLSPPVELRLPMVFSEL
jgi:hypothetical protein